MQQLAKLMGKVSIMATTYLPCRRPGNDSFIGFINVTETVLFKNKCYSEFFSMALIETFWESGHTITGHNTGGSLTVGYRKFRAFFGTSPLVCIIVWDLLCHVRPRNSKPEHLLWAMMLLKRYSIESVNAALTKVSEKTFRKWSLIFIELLGNMTVVTIIS